MILFLLVIFIYRINFNQNQNTSNIYLKDSLIITELLLKQPGYPLNWNTSNVEVFGLVKFNHLLSEQKIINFINLSTDNTSFTKKLLGLKEDFYFNLINKSNGQSIYNNSINLDDYTESFIISRFNQLNNSIILVQFGVLK